MEKLQDYQGWSGRFHEWRTGLKERVSNYREEHPESVSELARNFVSNQIRGNASTDQDFSHIYRKKTRLELIRISAAVMGIEFSYAAETAFVSPTLLKIGVEHKHMTLVWALSPLVGFFLTPILGSVSDRCKFNMGRRRPFIILLSIGVFLGLLLVPNGEELGYIFGDINPHLQDRVIKLNSTINNANISYSQSTADSANVEDIQPKPRSSHPWGIFFTILGTVFLDFHADACQSPSRAYLLDVTIPEDHARGLSTFTIMAGLGGFMGYSLGGIDWDRTYLGQHLGGHLKAVFTLITFIFVICVAATITSFKEIPLWIIAQRHSPENHENLELTSDAECTKLAEHNINSVSYGSLNEADAFEKNSAQQENKYIQPSSLIEEGVKVGGAIEENDDIKVENQASQGEAVASLSHYMLSIVLMPHSVRMVCLTNLFCWMAHVCYSLYFTDFVGESVFEGDPRALEGSAAQLLYEEGVRFGCWGMAMYSLSCACYSTVIEKLILKYRAKRVYVGGLLFYCAGMSLMALTKAKFSVIVFSWAAGVMYSTLFTLPYLLIAHYHATGTFAVSSDGEQQLGTEVRGLGTDIAIVSSMVFLAQFILSLCMGSIVSLAGTTTAVVSVASILSFCGALSATQIMYLDL